MTISEGSGRTTCEINFSSNKKMKFLKLAQLFQHSAEFHKTQYSQLLITVFISSFFERDFLSSLLVVAPHAQKNLPRQDNWRISSLVAAKLLKIIRGSTWLALASQVICVIVTTPTSYFFYRKNVKSLKHMPLDVKCLYKSVCSTFFVFRGRSFSDLTSLPTTCLSVFSRVLYSLMSHLHGS